MLDIRAFHVRVINNFSLPIALFEDLVNEWVENQRSTTMKKGRQRSGSDL